MSYQIITFGIDEQILGIDIMAIREIRAWSPTTRLPHMPNYVHGVVNLRGSVLPVFDLSARLGWNVTEPTARHVIIIIEVGEQLQGLIVDAVNDIVTLADDTLQPPPNTGEDPAATCLDGVASIQDDMVMVLSLKNLTEEIVLDNSLMAA